MPERIQYIHQDEISEPEHKDSDNTDTVTILFRTETHDDFGQFTGYELSPAQLPIFPENLISKPDSLRDPIISEYYRLLEIDPPPQNSTEFREAIVAEISPNINPTTGQEYSLYNPSILQQCFKPLSETPMVDHLPAQWNKGETRILVLLALFEKNEPGNFAAAHLQTLCEHVVNMPESPAGAALIASLAGRPLRSLSRTELVAHIGNLFLNDIRDEKHAEKRQESKSEQIKETDTRFTEEISQILAFSSLRTFISGQDYAQLKQYLGSYKMAPFVDTPEHQQDTLVWKSNKRESDIFTNLLHEARQKNTESVNSDYIIRILSLYHNTTIVEADIRRAEENVESLKRLTREQLRALKPEEIQLLLAIGMERVTRPGEKPADISDITEIVSRLNELHFFFIHRPYMELGEHDPDYYHGGFREVIGPNGEIEVIFDPCPVHTPLQDAVHDIQAEKLMERLQSLKIEENRDQVNIEHNAQENISAPPSLSLRLEEQVLGDPRIFEDTPQTTTAGGNIPLSDSLDTTYPIVPTTRNTVMSAVLIQQGTVDNTVAPVQDTTEVREMGQGSIPVANSGVFISERLERPGRKQKPPKKRARFSQTTNQPNGRRLNESYSDSVVSPRFRRALSLLDSRRKNPQNIPLSARPIQLISRPPEASVGNTSNTTVSNTHDSSTFPTDFPENTIGDGGNDSDLTISIPIEETREPTQTGFGADDAGSIVIKVPQDRIAQTMEHNSETGNGVSVQVPSFKRQRRRSIHTATHLNPVTVTESNFVPDSQTHHQSIQNSTLERFRTGTTSLHSRTQAVVQKNVVTVNDHIDSPREYVETPARASLKHIHSKKRSVVSTPNSEAAGSQQKRSVTQTQRDIAFTPAIHEVGTHEQRQQDIFRPKPQKRRSVMTDEEPTDSRPIGKRNGKMVNAAVIVQSWYDSDVFRQIAQTHLRSLSRQAA